MSRFLDVIVSASESDIRNDPTLDNRLLLGSSGPVTIFYAPFDHIQKDARVVILGITPGAQQAANALLELRRSMLAGHGTSASLAAAKIFASFSGPMRANLVEMLDYIGVHRAIGISSTSSLWGTNGHLVHFTSALRYPVYTNGKNYSGQPRIATLPLLAELLSNYLSEEARTLNDAIWIPLGPVATDAANWLVQRSFLDRSRVLCGLPHPSGANAERVAYFVGRKNRSLLSAKTNADTLDRAREGLLAQVASLNLVPS